MKLPMSGGSREPSAQLRAAAAQLHEMYTAMVYAGFTEHQAMQAIGEVLKSAVQAPPPGGESQ